MSHYHIRPADNFHDLVFAPAQIARFMGPTWGPPGSRRPQMGPMLSPWTLLSGRILLLLDIYQYFSPVLIYSDIQHYICVRHNTLLQCWKLGIIFTGPTGNSPWSFTVTVRCSYVIYPIYHYDNVIMGASHSSESLAFVRGIQRVPVNSPHKWPVTRKMFPFHDVIMH